MDPEALNVVIVGDRAKIEGPVSELGMAMVYLDYEGLPV
jgi:hypothetical protein